MQLHPAITHLAQHRVVSLANHVVTQVFDRFAATAAVVVRLVVHSHFRPSVGWLDRRGYGTNRPRPAVAARYRHNLMKRGSKHHCVRRPHTVRRHKRRRRGEGGRGQARERSRLRRWAERIEVAVAATLADIMTSRHRRVTDAGITTNRANNGDTFHGG